MEKFFTDPVAIEELEKMGDVETLAVPITLEALRDKCAGDSGLLMLVDDVESRAFRYTQAVIETQLSLRRGDLDRENMSRVDVRNRDAVQRRAHDVYIDSVKILARNLARHGKDTNWFNKFCPDAERAHDTYRPEFARFGLIITYREVLREIKAVKAEKS